MAGIDVLVHPTVGVLRIRLDQNAGKVKLDSVLRGQHQYGGMAGAILLIDAILDANVAVAESVNLQTAAA